MRVCFYLTDLVFKVKIFCHCYRMSRTLLLEILDGVREYDDYFEAKLDATSKVGLSSY
jgi:hypothetical protein